MNESSLSIGDANNKRALEDLVWTIEMSQGQFSLILALTNSIGLRDNMTQQLQELYPNIEEIVLKPSETLIYSKVKELIIQKHPPAVMVRGFESATDINKILISLNQVREDLWKDCKFPLILWINETIHQKMIRLTPDIESWASTTNFSSLAREQIDYRQEKIDSFNREQSCEDNAQFNDNFLRDFFRQAMFLVRYIF